MKVRKHWKSPRMIISLISAIIVLCVVGAFRGKYILTVYGFLDTAFQESQTGPAYESVSESYFRAMIADASDKTITRTRVEIEGRSIDVSFVPSLATQSADLEPTPVASDSAVSSDSGVLTRGDILGEIDVIREQILSRVGSTTQAYEGPHEVIRHEGAMNGVVVYSLPSHTLVEEWRLQYVPEQTLAFTVDHPLFTVAMNTNQVWQLRDGTRPVMEIVTECIDEGGSLIPLPDIQERIVIPGTGTPMQLVLPKEIVDTMKPIIIRRTYRPIMSQDRTLEHVLLDTVGESLATKSAILSFPPSAVAPYRGEFIVRNAQDRTMGFLHSDKTYEQLWVTGDTLVCQETQCVSSDGSAYVFFVPEDLRGLAPEASPSVSRVEVGDGPIGGIAAAGTILYRTAATSPGGGVYRLPHPEKDEQNVYTNYANSTEIAVNDEYSLLAFIGDGQLHMSTIGQKPHMISLPEPISSITYGSDGMLYGLISYGKANTRMVVRISSTGVNQEVLTNVYGDITGIWAIGDTLTMGLKLDEHHWALIPLLVGDMRWHTLENVSSILESTTGAQLL